MNIEGLDLERMLTPGRARKIGIRLITLLEIIPNEDGSFNTYWGDRDEASLGRAVVRVISESFSEKPSNSVLGLDLQD